MMMNTGKVEKRTRKKFLAAGEACMAVYILSCLQALEGEPFPLLALGSQQMGHQFLCLQYYTWDT